MTQVIFSQVWRNWELLRLYSGSIPVEIWITLPPWVQSAINSPQGVLYHWTVLISYNKWGWSNVPNEKVAWYLYVWGSFPCLIKKKIHLPYPKWDMGFQFLSPVHARQHDPIICHDSHFWKLALVLLQGYVSKDITGWFWFYEYRGSLLWILMCISPQ